MRSVFANLFIILLISNFVFAEEISILAVGDITIGSALTPILKKNGSEILFSQISKIIRSADISITTLNTSISDRGEPRYGLPHKPFRAIPEIARAISDAGFDLVSLATPHILDFGPDALADTIDLLRWSNVKSVGAGMTIDQANAHAEIVVGTKRVAFLAYAHGSFFANAENGTIAGALHSEMIETVKTISDQADLTVVMMHWGKSDRSENITNRQKFFTHQMIDHGADLVLCQRLHTFQGLEIYNGKPIIYALADFIYENFDKQHNRIVIPKITFVNRDLKSIELIPITVGDQNVKYQPKLLDGKDAIEALENYRELCELLGSTFKIESDRGWLKN